jgi:two-component system, LuxR family, sensor kinase FixL
MTGEVFMGANDNGNGGTSRAYQALRESEELHRATLGSISDAVFLADDTDAFTYICPNVDMIFGYVPDEVQAMGRITGLLGDNLFDHSELSARGEIRNVEREVTAKSGERRTVLIHFKRVSIRNGTVLCTCRDITELKRAERELAVTRLELAHAARLALVGELTASIMHEIRQPLTAILVNAGAGVRLALHSPELGGIFSEIERIGTDAAEMIEGLRTLTRKRQLELRPLDVNQVAKDVLQLVTLEAQRRRIELHANLSPVMPVIAADRVSLQQVLLNLILNAMDAVAEEQQRHIRVCTLHAAGGVEIEVSDTGPGIAADTLPKLFDPFFTTKRDGIGLGLPISRSIIEAHSGRIWAEGRSEGGATFRFTLPIQPPAAS